MESPAELTVSKRVAAQLWTLPLTGKHVAISRYARVFIAGFAQFCFCKCVEGLNILLDSNLICFYFTLKLKLKAEVYSN